MYSKTRNTLTALIAASLFVAAGWTFGHPIPIVTPAHPTLNLRTSIVDAGSHGTISISASSSRQASRMNLAMPYFSFSMQLPQRRND